MKKNLLLFMLALVFSSGIAQEIPVITNVNTNLRRLSTTMRYKAAAPENERGEEQSRTSATPPVPSQILLSIDFMITNMKDAYGITIKIGTEQNSASVLEQQLTLSTVQQNGEQRKMLMGADTKIIKDITDGNIALRHFISPEDVKNTNFLTIIITGPESAEVTRLYHPINH